MNADDIKVVMLEGMVIVDKRQLEISSDFKFLGCELNISHRDGAECYWWRSDRMKGLFR